jgi:hypothetical protein
MKRSKKQHILIAVPCEHNTVHLPVATFALEAIRQNAHRGCPYRFSVAFLGGQKPTEYARNVLVTTAVDNKSVDAIWFADEDMVPTWPDSFEMLKIDSDIIVGVAPIFSNKDTANPSFTWNIYRQIEDETITPELRCVSSMSATSFFPVGLNGGKPMQVDGAGTACMIIRRNVLEDKRLWIGGERFKDIIPFFTWPRGITGESLGTDDLDFCARARNLGYKITAVPSVKWGHLKELDLQWIMKKIQSLTVRPPQALLTTNDMNEYSLRYCGRPKFLYEHASDPKPSSEARE